MDKAKLYGFWVSPFMATVANTLREANIDFEYHRVSPYLGDTYQQAHLNRNALAKIPSYEDTNGQIISESLAICRYLSRTQIEFQKLYPSDAPIECSKVDQKMDFINFSISGPFFNWFVVSAYYPKAFGAKTEKESEIFSIWSAFNIQHHIQRLLDASALTPFLLGKEPTVADFQLFHILEVGKNLAKIFEMPIFDVTQKNERLTAFYNAVAKRASTQFVLNEQAKEMEITRKEIFEDFAKSLEEPLTKGKAVLSKFFGHEV